MGTNIALRWRAVPVAIYGPRVVSDRERDEQHAQYLQLHLGSDTLAKLSVRRPQPGLTVPPHLAPTLLLILLTDILLCLVLALSARAGHAHAAKHAGSRRLLAW